MPTSSKKSKKTPKKLVSKVRSSIQARLEDNPHRSFRLSRRRDYKRELPLPHPIAFIAEVFKVLWAQRRIFLPLMLIYGLLYAALVGITSQDTYSQIGSALDDTGSEAGVSESLNAFEKAGLTFLSIATGGVSTSLNGSQQMIALFLGLMAWLTTVWLLRNILAGNKVKMRDGLYNAGAPIISTICIIFVIVLQLIPAGFAAIGFAAAQSSGLIASGGVEAMLFWIAAGLLCLLSLYLISSSLFASIIVTLPGMYPLKALRTSRQLILGRRLPLLLRVIWMALFLAVLWAIIIIPVVLFDGWIKWAIPVIEWIPIVPFAVLVMSTFSIFWIAAYIYLLYRKVVDYES